MVGTAEIQRRLSELFAAVLNVDKVELDDDFFALGGHSLTAGRLTGAIRREMGVRITLSEFFTEPTVRGLTDLVLAVEPKSDGPNSDRVD